MGVQDAKSKVAVVKHFISVQNILLSLPNLANKICCIKGPLSKGTTQVFHNHPANLVYKAAKQNKNLNLNL